MVLGEARCPLRQPRSRCPDTLGHIANRVGDRVVILVKATPPVSWPSRRIVADRAVLVSLLLAGLSRSKEQCGGTRRPPS